MNIIKKIPLTTKNTYNSGIYNCSYKLLTLNNIDILNTCYNKIANINTNTTYNSITYNGDKNIYYVTKINDFNYIYILDSYYKEINKIKLNIPQAFKKTIVSIAYNNNIIYICIKNNVFSITTSGQFNKVELSKEIINELKYIVNKPCYKNEYEINLTSINFICNKLYIAYKKNNSSYIGIICNNEIKTYYIDDNITIKSILLVKTNIQFLCLVDNNYSYIYKTDYYCKNKEYDNICCINNYNECRVDIECHKDKKELEQIIESIALTECSLAHILNCEGMKICKAIETTDDICKLLKVNESVNETIKNTTRLEEILTNKLAITLNCLCKEKKPHCR